jgi:hypothetical protein
MATKRVPALMLAGCQAFLLGGMMSLAIAAAEAANLSTGIGQAHPLQLAQQESAPEQSPGAYGMGPGMGPGMGSGMGPGSQGMGPGMGPCGQGMGMGPGMGPCGQGMGPGMGPGGQGMGTPSEGGGQPMGPGFGAPGYGMHPGGQHHGMMGGPRGGYPMAKFNAIGAIDLTDEQRGKFDALRKELNTSVQEIMGKIRAENEKLRKLQEEQMRLGKTLSDLRGHMMQATMDATNRAKDLLTDDQRKAMIDQGRPTMMQPRSVPYAEPQGGATE